MPITRRIVSSSPSIGWEQWTTPLLPVRARNVIERVHEEFRPRIQTQTVLPSAVTAAMLFWALLAARQITMREVDGSETLTRKFADDPVNLAA